MQNVRILDGGMGQELLRRAVAEPTPLWSAQVMLDQPELVRDVHVAYLEAGADIITINAYSATRCRLAPAGVEDQYGPLQRLAGQLAVEARDAIDDPTSVTIAGCLSPYRWSYHPELALPHDELWPLFAETAALQAPYVDVMLCETMGSIDEMRSAIRGASTVGLPVWASWTLADDDTASLRSGEPLAEALDQLGDQVEVVMINCSTPEALTAAVPVLAASGLAFGAYANAFTHIASEFKPNSTVAELGARHDVTPEVYADTAMGWVEAGAHIVGGCCEVGPEHIATLAARLGRLPRHGA